MGSLMDIKLVIEYYIFNYQWKIFQQGDACWNLCGWQERQMWAEKADCVSIRMWLTIAIGDLSLNRLFLKLFGPPPATLQKDAYNLRYTPLWIWVKLWKIYLFFSIIDVFSSSVALPLHKPVHNCTSLYNPDFFILFLLYFAYAIRRASLFFSHRYWIKQIHYSNTKRHEMLLTDCWDRYNTFVYPHYYTASFRYKKKKCGIIIRKNHSIASFSSRISVIIVRFPKNSWPLRCYILLPRTTSNSSVFFIFLYSASISSSSGSVHVNRLVDLCKTFRAAHSHIQQVTKQFLILLFIQIPTSQSFDKSLQNF